MDYKKISLDKLIKQSYSKLPVKVEGIPRGVYIETEKTRSYICGFLQYKDKFIHFSAECPLQANALGDKSIFCAASESEIALKIKGLYSSKEKNYDQGRIIIHSVRLSNNEISFNQ